MPERIVIIGGGQAGGRVAQILANSSADFHISLIGREPHPPYNRPPLSKGVLLAKSGFEDCAIWREGDGAAGKIRFHASVAAKMIDTGAKNVGLDDGRVIEYDRLVLATGSRVRRVSMPGADCSGVYMLRTFDDAVKIAKQFHSGLRLVVVGGGFIGLEIAAAARTRGLHTVVVEATNRLLSRIAPQSIGDALARHHEQAGVSFRVGCMVERLISTRSGKLKSALLSNGETIPCDLAIVGVGVTADTELAASAGLDVQVGIRTDATLRTSDPNIFACGDAVSFWHPLFERHVRVEAWQNAEDHARVVAGRLMGQETICDTVPFFWSDQYELSMQIVGLPQYGSFVVSHATEDAQILYHLDPRGRLVGATGLGPHQLIGRKIRAARQAIAGRSCPDAQALKGGLIRSDAPPESGNLEREEENPAPFSARIPL
ncbi:NAD(P)/FAD-dependent oxidoreductase [Sinorhizobium medicae]|uniref:NAD(P)/FAD-dependent oxidoreductase n=1 Tax=Sinorhizobium medicae TaxID=110321 RepID=UPI000426C943|nr:FAD-dependent oxidoreductase [Sinorhizobium medicae]RVQ74387.1 NAD(P)/FAD-dependent oxidoreductase [Sinorhizobium medicae]